MDALKSSIKWEFNVKNLIMGMFIHVQCSFMFCILKLIDILAQCSLEIFLFVSQVHYPFWYLEIGT